MNSLQPEPDRSSAASRIGTIGLSLVLIAALVRIMAVFEPFPYWETDPLMMDTPSTGIMPLFSLGLDVTSLLGAALVIFGAARRGCGPALWEVACFAAGTAVALLHATVIEGGSIDNLVMSGVWVSAIASGLAANTAARDPRLRAFLTAALLGSAAMLAGKGMLQIFVEHPETVRTYNENRVGFLAAQGWTPDSAMARAFERRLFQTEASGWFGLSNVYASVAAGSLVALAGLTLAAWRRHPREKAGFVAAHRGALPEHQLGLPLSAVRWLLLLATALAAAAVVMSKSKGGIGAAVVGLALLAVATWAPGLVPASRRARALLALAVPVAVLAAVVVRGLIGERLGELSIFFRWFYMQGAARIFAQHPLLGVGPADFKEAYQLAKPVLATEDVMSPHSVFFDYIATLGVGGWAWVVLLLGWVGRMGIALVPAREHDDHAKAEEVRFSRNDARLLLVVISAAVLTSAYLERSAVSIESTLLRLLALAAWLGIGIACLALFTRGRAQRTHLALACAGLALIAHGQIEVTPVWTGAAAWFMMVVGSAATGRLRDPAADRPTPAAVPAIDTTQAIGTRRRLAGLAGAMAMSGAAAVIACSAIDVQGWQRALARAADDARSLAEIHRAVDGALSGASDAGQRTAAAAELSRALGRAVGSDNASLTGAAHEYALHGLTSAREQLAVAAGYEPHHFPTVRSLSRLLLEESLALDQMGRPQDAGRARSQAEDVIQSFAANNPSIALAWGWLGTVREGLAGPSRDPAALRRATEAWERAAALDPHGLQYPPLLAKTYASLGDDEHARPWARRTLELNDLQRLDPLQQLPPPDLDEMKRLAGAGGGH